MPREPATSSTADWPDQTIVLRGGIGDAQDLARRRSPVGRWSVFASPGQPMTTLARSVPHNRLRMTTLGLIRSGGGHLVVTPGPPYHCEVSGLTAIQLDAILGPPVLNPVPPRERWTP
jgi:hypothetical protein